MSKYFNETMKANQWAQQRLANQGLNVNHLPGSVVAPPRVAARSQEPQRANISDGQTARLVFRQDDASQAALEACRGLRNHIMRIQAESGVKSIVISSSLPGEGKTLTTMYLGLCFAELAQQRVLAIDADLRTCGLTSMLDHPCGPGLAEVLSGDVHPDEAIVRTNQKNLFVLPAGSVSSLPSELFMGDRWQELLAQKNELFEVVLVDSPPILPAADFELISAACDGVLMVVRARHGQRKKLRKTAGAIDQKKLLGVVFNARRSR
jgi:capsular exopolysaccharide synthesis family protein